MGYFHQVIDKLIEEYKVDKNRIYVVGWSNGGTMAYRLACEMSDRIAGVISYVGAFGMKSPYPEDNRS